MHGTIKFLVLASNSFSGANLIKSLLQGGINTVGISRSPELAPCFLPYKWLGTDLLSKYRFFQYDINDDLDDILELIRQQNITHIVNFAAQGMVRESWDNPHHWYQTNVTSTGRFIHEIAKIHSIMRYIHISTPEIYGNVEHELFETQPICPSTPYALSKAAGDLCAQIYRGHTQMKIDILRSANVYGAGQLLYRIIPKTIVSIKKEQQFFLHGGGVSMRSFIHIDDVSRAIIKLCNLDKDGDDYHLSGSGLISIYNLVAMICEKMSYNMQDLVTITSEAKGKDTIYQLNDDKMQALGWQAEKSLNAGLDEVIEWVNHHWDILANQPTDYIHKI